VVLGRTSLAPKVAFVFGASEPHAGMGRQLYETQPVFREALDTCADALKGVLEKPLVQVLYGPESALLKEAGYGHAAVFAVQWALARLWRAWGVEPDRVEGHGVGEDVAAVETGAFGLEEGLKRAVARKQQPARKTEAEKADGAEVRLEVVPPKPDRSEWAQVLETLSGLYVRGVEVDWAAYDAPYGRRRVVLPTYPFQRQRYWWRGATPHTATSVSRSDKPHLGRRLRSPALEALVYETTYARSRPVHLEDHRLFGTLVAAGSSHVSLVLSAIEDAHGSPACTLENLAFPQALVLAEDEERTVQAIITSHGQGSSFEVKSLSDADGAEKWVLHATGGLRIGQVAQPKRVLSHEELRARCQTWRSGSELYQLMHECGYTLGPAYQWIGSVARQGGELLGELRLPVSTATLEDYPLHPGLIDSCFQVLASWALESAAKKRDVLFIPFSMSRFIVHRRPRGRVWCHASIEGGEQAMAGEVIGGDLRILDEQGLVAEVLGFRGRLASREAVRLVPRARREESRYEVVWRPDTRPAPAPLADKRPWVLLEDTRGVAERLGHRLEAHGAPVVRVRRGATFRARGAGVFELDARRPQDFARLLDEATGKSGCAGVVSLWSLDARVPEDASAEVMQNAALEVSGDVVNLVKALAGRAASTPPLWLVTEGAQAVGEEERLALAQAPLWGLGRVIDLEHTELRCTRVDLDPENFEGSLRLLFSELGRDANAPGREVAFRGGMRLCPLLQRDKSEPGRALQLRSDATYLITGGLGGLGLEVARWMVEQGARHLVLVGRRAASASASEQVRALEQAGARVTVASVDVSKEAEVARLLQQVDAASPPLRGLVHAAGVLADAALLQQDPERFERVMAPKVAGAWNLHRLTEGRALDFFVLFSSASATLGSAGQGNYAAANTFLDALAHERRARGLAGQSLAWGPWAETGMAGESERGNLARVLERRGVRSLPTQEALALFAEALAGGRPHLAILSIQWAMYLEGRGTPARSSFYATLAPVRVTEPRGLEPQAQTAPRYPLAERLQAALPQERPEVLARSLQQEVARILRLDASSELDWRQGFAELGMDSLMAIELRNVLQKGLGRTIPATVALDHPTIDFLVKHLLDEVLKLEGTQAPPPPERKPEAEAAVEPELDALSDAELARLVAEDLAKDS
jgi:acyl transferase domain-containing protein/acyl carrier protein